MSIAGRTNGLTTPGGGGTSREVRKRAIAERIGCRWTAVDWREVIEESETLSKVLLLLFWRTHALLILTEPDDFVTGCVHDEKRARRFRMHDAERFDDVPLSACKKYSL